MSLPVHFGVEGNRVGWSQRPQLMALEKWKCRLGKENLETRLSVQSWVLEGRSWEGEREDAGAGSWVPVAQPLPRDVGPLAVETQPARLRVGAGCTGVQCIK